MINIRLMRGKDIIKELPMDDSEMKHPIYEEPISIVLKRGDEVVTTLTNVRDSDPYSPKYTKSQKMNENNKATYYNNSKGKKDTVQNNQQPLKENISNSATKSDKDIFKKIVQSKKETTKQDVNNSSIIITKDEYYGIKNSFIPKPNNIDQTKEVIKSQANNKLQEEKEKEDVKETLKGDTYEKALGLTITKKDQKIQGKKEPQKLSDTDEMMKKYIEEYDDTEYDNFEKISKSKNLDLY